MTTAADEAEAIYYADAHLVGRQAARTWPAQCLQVAWTRAGALAAKPLPPVIGPPRCRRHQKIACRRTLECSIQTSSFRDSTLHPATRAGFREGHAAYHAPDRHPFSK